MSAKRLQQLAGIYDRVAKQEINTITNINNDEIRADIDHAICQVLGLPSLNELRNELANEPIIKLRPCVEDEGVSIVPDPQLEFELI